MTEQKEEQELPTAAYRWRDKAGPDQSSINNPEDEWCDSYSQMHGKEELVRREDVEQLIQNKIGELEEGKKGDGYKALVLEELLEEVQIE